MTLWVLKCVAVAGGLGAWFLTQAWIGKRPFPSGELQDRVHDLFYDSLIRFGMLALGHKESIRFSPHADSFEELDPVEKLYRKVT